DHRRTQWPVSRDAEREPVRSELGLEPLRTLRAAVQSRLDQQSLRAAGLTVQPQLGDEPVRDAGTTRGAAESADEAAGLVKPRHLRRHRAPQAVRWRSSGHRHAAVRATARPLSLQQLVADMPRTWYAVRTP